MASPNLVTDSAVDRIRTSAFSAAQRGLTNIELPILRHESLELAEYCRDKRVYRLSLDTIENIILTNQAVMFGAKLICV